MASGADIVEDDQAVLCEGECGKAGNVICSMVREERPIYTSCCSIVIVTLYSFILHTCHYVIVGLPSLYPPARLPPHRHTPHNK